MHLQVKKKAKRTFEQLLLSFSFSINMYIDINKNSINNSNNNNNNNNNNLYLKRVTPITIKVFSLAAL